MFGRRKGFSPARSHRATRRMRESMVGTHHVAPHRPSTRSGALGEGYAAPRRNRRAVRGYVDNVGTAATSGESARSHAHRVSQREYVRGMQRRARFKGVAVLVLAALLVVGIAGFVGVSVYFNTANSKLSLGDSNVESALVAPGENEPYYVLCAARLGAVRGEQGARTDQYLLARVDEAAGSLAFVRVPSNVQVKLSDGGDHPLHEASSQGGDAALVRAVSSLMGVDVAHFVKTDEAGLQGLVDLVGGLQMDLAEEIDDPNAGSLYIPAGPQEVTRDNVLVFLRAANYREGIATQTANQVDFMCALAQRLLEASGFDSAAQLDGVAACLETDMEAAEIMALADALRGIDWDGVSSTVVPGYENEGAAGEESTYSVSGSGLKELMERLAGGEGVAEAGDALAAIDPASYTVEVRNGAGIAGAAAACAEMLRAAGFVEGPVGNSQDYVTYPETLVVYNDAANEQAAEAVVQAIGAGRTVDGGAYYTFDTQVLVVIGKDWQPIVQ